MRVSEICGIVAGLSAVAGVAALVAPAAAARAVRAFPRSVWTGRLLALLAYAWVTWYLWVTPIDWFEPFRPYLWVIAPAVYLITVLFVDDLLAARALGGILLIIPYPTIEAARWTGTPVRYILVIAAYAWALAGAFLMASPWWFRRTLAPFAASPRLLRLLAAGVLGDAVLFGWMAFFFYARGM